MGNPHSPIFWNGENLSSSQKKDVWTIQKRGKKTLIWVIDDCDIAYFCWFRNIVVSEPILIKINWIGLDLFRASDCDLMFCTGLWCCLYTLYQPSEKTSSAKTSSISNSGFSNFYVSKLVKPKCQRWNLFRKLSWKTLNGYCCIFIHIDRKVQKRTCPVLTLSIVKKRQKMKPQVIITSITMKQVWNKEMLECPLIQV